MCVRPVSPCWGACDCWSLHLLRTYKRGREATFWHHSHLLHVCISVSCPRCCFTAKWSRRDCQIWRSSLSQWTVRTSVWLLRSSCSALATEICPWLLWTCHWPVHSCSPTQTKMTTGMGECYLVSNCTTVSSVNMRVQRCEAHLWQICCHNWLFYSITSAWKAPQLFWVCNYKSCRTMTWSLLF